MVPTSVGTRRLVSAALSHFCALLRSASGAVQPGLNAVKRAIPSRLGRPLSPFHPPSHPHGGPARPPLPLLVWTRLALSGPLAPPKKPPPGGRQVPLSPLEWELRVHPLAGYRQLFLFVGPDLPRHNRLLSSLAMRRSSLVAVQQVPTATPKIHHGPYLPQNIMCFDHARRGRAADQDCRILLR